jgi:phospholipid/cholesterol/gamma-HCH transport system permease protein
MKQLYGILENIGSTLVMGARAIRYINTLPRQFPRFVEQCYLIGYTTMPIVTILCFFIGSRRHLARSSSLARWSALPWCVNSPP